MSNFDSGYGRKRLIPVRKGERRCIAYLEHSAGRPLCSLSAAAAQCCGHGNFEAEQLGEPGSAGQPVQSTPRKRGLSSIVAAMLHGIPGNAVDSIEARKPINIRRDGLLLDVCQCSR